jgi:hypothetical protein
MRERGRSRRRLGSSHSDSNSVCGGQLVQSLWKPKNSSLDRRKAFRSIVQFVANVAVNFRFRVNGRYRGQLSSLLRGTASRVSQVFSCHFLIRCDSQNQNLRWGEWLCLLENQIQITEFMPEIA